MLITFKLFNPELFMYQLKLVHIYSLYGNSIGTAGVQAVAEGLQQFTSLQKLK